MIQIVPARAPPTYVVLSSHNGDDRPIVVVILENVEDSGVNLPPFHSTLVCRWIHSSQGGLCYLLHQVNVPAFRHVQHARHKLSCHGGGEHEVKLSEVKVTGRHPRPAKPREVCLL